MISHISLQTDGQTYRQSELQSRFSAKNPTTFLTHLPLNIDNSNNMQQTNYMQ